MKLKEIKDKLCLEIDDALSKGWKMRASMFIHRESKCCCALGAYYAAAGECDISTEEIMENRAEEFGVSIEQLWTLAMGFDGVEMFTNTPFNTLGRQLREKYLK